MVVILVIAFVMGTSPAFACLVWAMKRLTEQEQRQAGARDFLERAPRLR